MNKLNDKASNVCVYIICIVLLLGMVRGVADAGGGGESDVAVRGRVVNHACEWAPAAPRLLARAHRAQAGVAYNMISKKGSSGL